MKKTSAITVKMSTEKMAKFSKFKMLFALKLNLNGGQFQKKYQNCFFFKSWNNQNKGETKKLFDKFIEHLPSKVT